MDSVASRGRNFERKIPGAGQLDAAIYGIWIFKIQMRRLSVAHEKPPGSSWTASSDSEVRRIQVRRIPGSEPPRIGRSGESDSVNSNSRYFELSRASGRESRSPKSRKVPIQYDAHFFAIGMGGSTRRGNWNFRSPCLLRDCEFPSEIIKGGLDSAGFLKGSNSAAGNLNC